MLFNLVEILIINITIASFYLYLYMIYKFYVACITSCRLLMYDSDTHRNRPNAVLYNILDNICGFHASAKQAKEMAIKKLRNLKRKNTKEGTLYKK